MSDDRFKKVGRSSVDSVDYSDAEEATALVNIEEMKREVQADARRPPECTASLCSSTQRGYGRQGR